MVNKWIDFVKKYASKHKLSYWEAVKDPNARISYQNHLLTDTVITAELFEMITGKTKAKLNELKAAIFALANNDYQTEFVEAAAKKNQLRLARKLLLAFMYRGYLLTRDQYTNYLHKWAPGTDIDTELNMTLGF